MKANDGVTLVLSMAAQKDERRESRRLPVSAALGKELAAPAEPNIESFRSNVFF
jgi:hypothetical protein